MPVNVDTMFWVLLLLICPPSLFLVVKSPRSLRDKLVACSGYLIGVVGVVILFEVLW